MFLKYHLPRVNNADLQPLARQLRPNLLGEPVGRRLACAVRDPREALLLHASDATDRARDEDKLLVAPGFGLGQQRPTPLKEAEWADGIDLKVIAQRAGIGLEHGAECIRVAGVGDDQVEVLDSCVGEGRE